MHELSIALCILDVAAEKAEQCGSARVRAIHLKLGELSGVIKQALNSAYTLAREHSALVDAELLIEEVPIRIHCPHCQADRPIVSMQDFVCAECGTASADVRQGRELEVVALEIE
jgi:hydrogenase nickel incorporation protein HypA/HybF